MDKGELDAMSNLDPVITQLESTGKYVAVADSRTEKGMKDLYGGDYMASVIYVTDEYLKKNPNTVQAVVNAMVRADKWIAKATPQGEDAAELVEVEYEQTPHVIDPEQAIKDGSPLAGRTLRDADVGRRTGVIVIAVKRADGRVEFPPTGDEPFARGDSIVALGRRANLDQFRHEFSI